MARVPACHRHHSGATIDSSGRTTPEGWTVCSSGTAHSTTKQTAHIPRVTGLRQVPAGGHGNGGRRPMESGIGRIPPPPGATQSPISSCPITTSHSHLAHQPLVSHPRPRRHARLRGFFALVAGGWTGQRRGGSATPRATPRPTRSRPPTPVDFQGGEGAQPLTFPSGLCLWISLVDLALDFTGLNYRNFGGPAADRKKVREKKTPRFGCVFRTTCS